MKTFTHTSKEPCYCERSGHCDVFTTSRHAPFAPVGGAYPQQLIASDLRLPTRQHPASVSPHLHTASQS